LAIRIGPNVLKVAGNGECCFNGVFHDEPPFQATMGGSHALEHGSTKKGTHVYKIHPDDEQEMDIREHKEWITITVLHAKTEEFCDTASLMGSFLAGNWMARDGTTAMDSIDVFGQEWQVKEASDGLLFHKPSPCPDKSHLPAAAHNAGRGRRLLESSVLREDAVVALANWGTA